MRMFLRNVFQLGIKELFSLRRDVVMMVLIFYGFSFNIFVPAQHAQTELRNAAIAVVDEDDSQLSRAIPDALLLPYFKKPMMIQAADIDRVMDTGLYTFVIDIPPNFQRDILAGRQEEDFTRPEDVGARHEPAERRVEDVLRAQRDRIRRRLVERVAGKVAQIARQRARG